MLSDYVKHEARAAWRPHHTIVLAAVAVVSLGLSALMPGFPPAIYRFFLRVFAMRSWTEIILINDLMGVFFGLYWVGVADLLRVYVVPREEGYLDILLAKPVGRVRYLLARVLPRFAAVGAIGVALSLFLPLKVALINGTADLDAPGVVCAGLATTAAVLALLALLNLVFLYTRETYYAVVLAFVVFMIAALPGSMYIYRPDVYASHPVARDLLVFPGNLLWYSARMPRLLPVVVAVAAVASAGLLAASGRRLRSSDVA